MLWQARRNQVGGGGGGGLQAPLVFAKVDLLPIDNYREKEKITNKNNAN